MTEPYSSVGKLGKPHGISGAFRFYFDKPLLKKRALPKHFLLHNSGTYTPWFVKSIEFIGLTEGVICFEEITTPEQAKILANQSLYLEEKTAGQYFSNKVADDFSLTGFSAVDTETGYIGTVEELLELPGQQLLKLNCEGKEVLVPYVEAFVVKLDKKKKEITLQLPEGLLSL